MKFEKIKEKTIERDGEMNIKDIRKRAGLSQQAFAKRYGIPIGTLHHWEAGDRKPPEYVLRLLSWHVDATAGAGKDHK